MKQVALSVIFRICCFDGRILISENRFDLYFDFGISFTKRNIAVKTHVTSSKS